MLHIPVLVEKVVDFLQVEPGGIYVDCTTGTGGHSKAILEAGCRYLIGLDVDFEQLQIAKYNLSGFKGRFFLVKANYGYIGSLLKVTVNGVLIDAGVSSYQMDDENRGFSFRKGGKLDMRFNKDYGETALELIRKADVDELARILRVYGGLSHSYGIAKRIKEEDVESVEELVVLLRKTFRRERAHKELAKVFQALRIGVNRELENLEKGVKGAWGVLKEGGRFVCITYHSGEDRVVLRAARETGFKLLTKKPVKPDKEEFQNNPRSRSARLRAFEK